jgi:TLC domain
MLIRSLFVYIQRPFLNFYGPTFILYELSSPFLNIHWFLDKLHLTGSKYQWYNGIVLLASFFGCRLVWGTYQSIRVYQDVWAALHLPLDANGYLSPEIHTNITRGAQDLFIPRDGGLCLGKAECIAAQSEVMKFVGPGTGGVPIWLAVTYLSSNVVLNSLNFYWFGKMIETVRKRFEKKPEAPKAGEGKDEKKANANGEKESVKRRRESIVLDVADGLEKDERLRLMMDGAMDGDYRKLEEVTSKMNAEQRRDLEDALDDKAKSTALENNRNRNNNTTHEDGDGARRR